MSQDYGTLFLDDFEISFFTEAFGPPDYFFKSSLCELAGWGIFETYPLNLNNSYDISDFTNEYSFPSTFSFPLIAPIGFCAFNFESNEGKLIVPMKTAIKLPNKGVYLLYFEPIDQSYGAPEEPQDSNFEIRHLDKDFEFEKKINSALELIEYGVLQKVVISRAIDVVTHSEINKYSILKRLISLNPDAFVFMYEDFLGASPELLIELKDGQFKSNPLAGTIDQSQDKGLLYSEKNLLEHDILVNYVKEKLFGFSKLLSVSKLKERRIQDIIHLSTKIEGKLNRDANIIDITAALHPTPAVLGLPIELAYWFVKRYESAVRNYYSAPVGFVDGNGNGQLAVAIRSLHVTGKYARIWAGAGIVKGSEPKDELNEINAKLNSVVRVFGNEIP